jgi:hypothetical protein
VKERGSYANYLGLAVLFVAVVVVPILRRDLLSESSATNPAPASASSSTNFHETSKGLSASESHSIAMQSPGAVLGQGGDGLKIQGVIAHCANGYIPRGSTCEIKGQGK